jgi:hypothetical protein
MLILANAEISSLRSEKLKVRTLYMQKYPFPQRMIL